MIISQVTDTALIFASALPDIIVFVKKARILGVGLKFKKYIMVEQ